MDKAKLGEIKALHGKLEQKAVKLSNSPEQSRLLHTYMTLVDRKNPIVEKLIDLDIAITALISSMQKKSKFPQEIVDSLKAVQTLIKTVLSKTYTDEDIRQMKNMIETKFSGYSPLDVEKIIDQLNAMLFQAIAIAKKPNGKDLTLEATERIQEDLKTLKTDFDKLTADQLNKHLAKPEPTDEINALKEKAITLKSRTVSLDSATIPLVHIQDAIRKAIENAKELNNSNDINNVIKPSEITKQFETLIVQVKGNQKDKIKETFDTVWKKISHYENKLTALAVLLQKSINRLNELNKPGNNLKIYTELVFKSISMKYFIGEIHKVSCIPLDAWYERIKGKLSNEPMTNWNAVIEENGHIFDHLYDDATSTLKENVDKLSKFLNEELPNSIGKAINEGDNLKKDSILNEIKMEFDSMKTTLEEILEKMEENKDLYFFAETLS